MLIHSSMCFAQNHAFSRNEPVMPITSDSIQQTHGDNRKRPSVGIGPQEDSGKPHADNSAQTRQPEIWL